MLGSYFYHERIRKSVAMFGSLFNNIYVLRKNSSGGTIGTVKVPISYAPRDQALVRIRDNANLDTDTGLGIKLPRLSFEMLAFTYAPERQLQKMGKIQKSIPSDTTVVSRNKIYNYVPYTISFQLNLYAKSQDDGLQILEQILPYFTPQYSLTIKPFSDYADVKEDVPIILQGVAYSDTYEGAVGDRRVINYQLDFEMHANFYGPFNAGKIIRDVETNQYLIGAGSADSDVWVSKINILPNPLGASADSDYGFTTTITNTVDSA
jgi:hypothetical protein|tara:strand:+ start:98 stop:889 length:792 start_codon:yes stop_codon:yes gene_type:complete